MKLQTRARLIAGLGAFLAAGNAVGQGTFQNLGFESATLVPVPGDPSFYYFAQAFPGWTGYIGGVQPGLCTYDDVPLSGPGFAIVDSGFSGISGGGLIQGNFTAFLQSGGVGMGEGADTTLEQTGLVPVGTQTLLFEAELFGAQNYFGVTLGGQTLSLVPLQSGANYTLYGVDIHTWAGQTAELAFTSYYPYPHVGEIPVYLDAIQFSNQGVPEPSVLSLSALGAMLLGWRVMRRR